MSLISIGGLGSGLDVTGIVDAMVEAEKTPKKNSLDRQETKVNVALSGLGGLEASLKELRTAAFDLSLPSNFNKRIVTPSTNDFFSTSVSSGANPANYDIKVQNIATGTKLQSAIFTEGSTTTFGTGSLTFSVGINSFSVDVSATDTLADIRNNINNAAGNNFAKINLLNNVSDLTNTGSLLIADSSITGSGNDLIITYSGDDSLASLATDMSTIKSAANAEVIIDGLTTTSSTNSITEVISGLTIDLSKAHGVDDEPTRIEIALDTATPKKLVSNFVEVYNAFVAVTKQLGSADSNNPGLLVGDYTLRQVSSQIKSLFTTSLNTADLGINNLAALGLTTTREGTLEIDNDLLAASIADNSENIGNLFTGNDGFATKLRDLVQKYTGSGGVIKSREEALHNKLNKIADARLALSQRIEKLQTRLTKQFSVMDNIVARMNSTQGYIQQQFDNLPGFSNNKKK